VISLTIEELLDFLKSLENWKHTEWQDCAQRYSSKHMLSEICTTALNKRSQLASMFSRTQTSLLSPN